MQVRFLCCHDQHRFLYFQNVFEMVLANDKLIITFWMPNLETYYKRRMRSTISKCDICHQVPLPISQCHDCDGLTPAFVPQVLSTHVSTKTKCVSACTTEILFWSMLSEIQHAKALNKLSSMCFKKYMSLRLVAIICEILCNSCLRFPQNE